MVETPGPPAVKNYVGWAIGLMLLTNLLFSFVDTSTKWLLGSGMVAIQLAFARYFTHFAITLVDIRRSPSRAERLPPRLLMWVVLRSLCLVSATVVNFFALGHLSLAVSSSLLFVAPILVCLFSGVLLNEKVSKGQWAAILLGFTGVLFIVQPFGEAVNWYAVLMLYPATGMAFYSILTRKLSNKVTPATMQFYSGALGSVLLFPAAFFVWENPSNGLNWTLFVLIGAFAWAGHEAMTRAHKYAGASVLMPFSYSFVIYLTIASWLVFDEIPDKLTVLGSFTIALSGLAIWRLRRAD